MSEKAAAALEIYKTIIGEEEGVCEWLEIDQDSIKVFYRKCFGESKIISKFGLVDSIFDILFHYRPVV